jgi:hypothetical protein
MANGFSARSLAEINNNHRNNEIIIRKNKHATEKLIHSVILPLSTNHYEKINKLLLRLKATSNSAIKPVFARRQLSKANRKQYCIKLVYLYATLVGHTLMPKTRR